MLRQVVTELIHIFNTGKIGGGQKSWVAIIAFVIMVVLLVVVARRVRQSQGAAKQLRESTLQLVATVFQVDTELGFLAPDPVKRLPSPYQAWEDLMDRLPELNATGRLRDAVHELPRLSFEDLESDVPCLRRAHVMLSMIVQSYLHGPSVPWNKSSEEAFDRLAANGVTREEVLAACGGSRKREEEGEDEGTDDAADELPEVIARPFYFVCQRLGFPHCICSAATFDTWNWQKVSCMLEFAWI